METTNTNTILIVILIIIAVGFGVWYSQQADAPTEENDPAFQINIGGEAQPE